MIYPNPVKIFMEREFVVGRRRGEGDKDFGLVCFVRLCCVVVGFWEIVLRNAGIS